MVLARFRTALTACLLRLAVPLSFGVILDALVGRQGASADEAAAAAAAAEWDPEEAATLVKLEELRARCFDNAVQAARLEEELCNVPRPVADCLVEVKVPPDVLEKMLNRASSAAERAAWIAGQPLGSQGRRLLLSAGPSPVLSAEGDDILRKRLYEEAREWWERHCSL